MTSELEEMLAERAIARVLQNYARGIDRLDLDLVASCYWPGASDDHGTYSGDAEGFVAWAGGGLQRFERTMHVLANCIIEVDLPTDAARVETYCLAYHRFADGRDAGGSGGPTDVVTALRYLDRFERRRSEWRLAKRVLAYEWGRLDPVGPEKIFGRRFQRGSRDEHDPLWHIMNPH
jgi:SnoaL-like domain